VAVKILAPELASDAAFRTRLFRESRAAAAMGHPGILPVYEAGDVDGTVYLAMRYIRGADARSLLNRLGPPPPSSAWQIIAQVASTLDAAHAGGLIHRDVKPANMLLEARSEGSEGSEGSVPDWAGYDLDHVYLSDFGMSRDSPPEEIIATGQFAGTLDYLAPEQVRGSALDGRADLYSLACAGFELLCGTTPFGQDQGLTVLYAQLYAPPPAATALRPGLPAAVDRVLATALAKEPADRYATCGQFADELHAALGLAAPGLPGERSRPGESAGTAADPGVEDGQDPEDGQDTEDRQDMKDGQDTEDRQDTEGWQDTEGRQGGPRRLRARLSSGVMMLILAVVVAVLAAVTTDLILSNRTTTAGPAVSSPAATTPSPASASPSPVSVSQPPLTAATASRQAAAVNSLLSSSAAARAALQHAVSQADSCTGVPAAVSQIQNVVSKRSAEYQQAVGLSTSALANGVMLKSDLIAALRDSLNADKDYLTWAQQQLKPGCTPAAKSNTFTAAYLADQQAGAAKEAFLRMWNPIAAKYGIQQKSPDSI
jgi:serine/threonine protein kinase